jgi:DNA-binding NtrC family response regulator
MVKKLKILAVDDEDAMREVLRLRLEAWGYEVFVAADGDQARRLAERHGPAAVVSDVVLPDVAGLELLEWLKAGDGERPVILITAHANVETAVEAMKKGALDYLTKPLDYPRLKAVLADAENRIEQRRATRRVKARLERGAGVGGLLGESKAIRELVELVRVVAASDASAILTGESGTGKELVCRTIHDLSARKDGPFVGVNTAALPEGITESELFGHEKGAFTGALASRPGFFEQADRGTLFLDEIAEMPPPLQPKLLRVLEERRVRRLGARLELSFDVRVIAATNREPRRAVQEGLLREDLFYRLSVFTLELPPLREHAEDVPLLAQHFVQRFNARHGAAVEGIAGDALELLQRFSWPGNVRELRNVIERATILAKDDWIELRHLPPYLRDPAAAAGDEIVLPGGVTSAEAEKILILETLKRLDNNKAAAARRLGVDVKTIRNKLRSYGIDGEG